MKVYAAVQRFALEGYDIISVHKNFEKAKSVCEKKSFNYFPYSETPLPVWGEGFYVMELEVVD